MIKEIYDLATPCYIIDKEKFYNNVNCIEEAFKSYWGGNVKLGYSIKTNHMNWFLKEAYTMGFMAEAVSGDEVELAVEQGYEPENIILNGPQKREKDIELILTNGGIVNIDNFADIDILKSILLNKKRIVGKVGIRINFDLEKECSGETTAGKEVSRFGICMENGDLLRSIHMLEEMDIPISGLHLHFSTKTRSKKIFSTLAHYASRIVQEYSLKNIEYIDIGGGFFGGQKNVNFPTMKEYADCICQELLKTIDPCKVMLILEPGASIIATAVEYLTEVINERYIRDTKILTTDGSILHINPFMNKRVPHIEWVNNRQNRKCVANQIICGSTCMENDRFISIQDCSEVLTKDRIKISYVGAYTMAFNSCFINLPPKIYVKVDEGWQLLRKPDLKIANLI